MSPPADSDDESDLELRSDISDEDGQKMLQEIKSIDVGAIQRDLAASTIHRQEATWKSWSEYSQSISRSEPLKVLKKAGCRIFIGYFLWYRRSHERAKRLNTYESIWKWIRQLYYDKFRVEMPDAIGKPVTDYLHTTFCDTFSLVRGMKQTFTVGHHTLHGMFHYFWCLDTSGLVAYERDRVQVSFVTQQIAFVVARTGTVVESGTAGIRGSNQAPTYRDYKLKLLNPPDDESLLVLEVTLMYDKGKRKRSEPRTFTLYENRACPAMCPVIMFCSIAFADNAFHPALMAQGLCPAKMHSFKTPEGRIDIEFRFREDILDIPVCRAFERHLTGIRTHPTKAMSAVPYCRIMKRLGQMSGLPHPFRPYCLRREGGTELTG